MPETVEDAARAALAELCALCAETQAAAEAATSLLHAAGQHDLAQRASITGALLNLHARRLVWPEPEPEPEEPEGEPEPEPEPESEGE